MTKALRITSRKYFPFVSLPPLFMKRKNERNFVSLICIGKSILLVMDTATSFHLNLHCHYPEAEYRLTTIGKVNSNLSLVASTKFTYQML